MMYDLITQHIRKHYKYGDIDKGFFHILTDCKKNMNYHNNNIGILEYLETYEF